MPSARGDSPFKAGRPRWWVAGLVLCLLLAGTAVLLWRQPSRVADLPPSPTPGKPTATTDSREADASALLSKLVRGLENGPKSTVTSLGFPEDAAARAELSAIFHNARNLRLTDLSMRYVDEDAGRISGPRQRRLGGEAWVGHVQVTWRIRRFDSAPSRLEVPITFARTDTGVTFVSARGRAGDQTPLWLQDRLEVARKKRTLVMVADPNRLHEFSTMAARAVAQVNLVLPRWRGDLVVTVPASQRQMDRALGSNKGQYDAIAAVTTTPDGSLSKGAAAHVFVNPPVFDPLGRRGSQIVMTHEAAHVATGAATASMPSWLLEGFADYVALAHVDLPVDVTASQILGRVRDSGPPKRLPGRDEFDPAHTGLGASYEAAWLACRLIAEEYGEQRLVRFYRTAERASSTDAAFRHVLGTTEKRFTVQWRDYLRRLAA